jgi:hypothetical protein
MLCGMIARTIHSPANTRPLKKYRESMSRAGPNRAMTLEMVITAMAEKTAVASIISGKSVTSK